MENAKLLQDITYYSRMISREKIEREKYQKLNKKQDIYKQGHQYSWNAINKIAKNNYKYIKPKCEPLQSSSELCSNKIKVLINPHFKKTANVHINPNFSTKVHINPKLMSLNCLKMVESNSIVEITNKPIRPLKLHVNPKIIKLNCVKIIQSNPVAEEANNKIVGTSKLHINPKIIKLNSIKMAESNTIVEKTNNKIIRKPVSMISNSIKTKYKLDRRTNDIQKKMKKRISLTTNLKNIDGTLYKTSRNKLQKSDPSKKILKFKPKLKKCFRFVKETEVKSPKTKTNCSKYKFIKKETEIKSPKVKRNCSKYKFIKKDTENKAQKSKRNCSKYKFIKKETEIKSQKTKRNYSKYKFIKKETKVRKLKSGGSKYRKNNVPCPIYCRYGKCSSYEKGTCRRRHDPNLIAICKKYIQGGCDLQNCQLSHNITLEKMPTCKFYLEGFCSKVNCPYLHVKLNQKVEICKQFLQGFCQAADQCDKRHEYLCPDFERDGNCQRIKCQLPHGNNSNDNKSVIDKNIINEEVIEAKDNLCRYYDVPQNANESDNNSIEQNINATRTDLKNQLCPDFIPF